MLIDSVEDVSITMSENAHALAQTHVCMKKNSTQHV